VMWRAMCTKPDQQVLVGQVHRESQSRGAAGYNGNLEQRLCMLEHPANHGMACLVVRHRVAGTHRYCGLRHDCPPNIARHGMNT